jgi:hypothetical protein
LDRTRHEVHLMACNGYLPPFQAQSPAISHYKYGWTSCTAFAGAMAAAFDSCGKVRPTGGQVRQLTNEPVPDPKSPGLNLDQVDDALRKLGVDLDTRKHYPWDELVRRVSAGQGCILQIDTKPFLGTPYQSTAGAIGHAVFVPPNWGVMDPAADGRNGYHCFDGRAYPRELLKRAAGLLIVGRDPEGPIRCGYGYAYASFTRDQRSTWQVRMTVAPGARKAFWWYQLHDGVIVGRRVDSTRGFGATCTPPRLVRWPGGPVASKSLVRLTSGSRAGRWIESRFAHEVP